MHLPAVSPAQVLEEIPGAVPAAVVDEEEVKMFVPGDGVRELPGTKTPGFIVAGDDYRGLLHNAHTLSPGILTPRPFRKNAVAKSARSTPAAIADR